MQSRVVGRLSLFAAGLVLTGSLAACSTGAGQCVGAAPSVMSLPGAKTLLNLDKNGLALQGYDPVAYFTLRKPVKGDPAHRATSGEAVYQFVSEEHRAMFIADPAKYTPQFGGYCAYAASINTLSPISPEYWEVVDGRLLLQHNQKAWDLWHKDAAGNLVKADRNWPGLVDHNGSEPRTLLNIDQDGLALGGYDPVAYFTDARPVQGDPTIERSYQGATYRFASVEHKNLFEMDPAKYVPRFGGFCGYAASINKVSPIDPTIWQLVDGHLVLQHTPKAYQLFNADAQGNYARAEQNWPGLSRRRCE
ncbi:MAG: hypothetical protein IT436_07605 [Phycisphaerales bacterium]|nr:hypothetical protein [Phycisphaerales bacterium]